MIAQLKGVVTSITLNRAIIDVGGVGYEVIISPQLISTLREGSEALIHTSAVIREDSWQLFGFAEMESKQLFVELQGVSGIGPKAAYSLLSALTPTEVKRAIGSGEAGVLESVPGIGKKMASRIILELKERYLHALQGSRSQSSWRPQVLQALIGLGYTAKEGDAAIDRASTSSSDDFEQLELSEILRQTLAQSRSQGAPKQRK